MSAPRSFFGFLFRFLRGRWFRALRDGVPERGERLRERVRRFQMNRVPRAWNDDAARPGQGVGGAAGDIEIFQVALAREEENVLPYLVQPVSQIVVRPLSHAAERVREPGGRVRKPSLMERRERRGGELPLRLEERERSPVIGKPSDPALLDPPGERVIGTAAPRAGLRVLDPRRSALQNQ